MAAIFDAWKFFVDEKLRRPSTTRRPTTSVVAGGNVNPELVFDEASLGSGGSRPETSQSIYGAGTAHVEGGVTCVPYSRLLPNIMNSCTRMFSAAQSGNLDPFVAGNAYLMFCQAICLSHSIKRKKMDLLLAPIRAAEKAAADAAEARRLEKERREAESEESDRVEEQSAKEAQESLQQTAV